MCTVAELILALQKLPPEAVVCVLKEQTAAYQTYTTYDIVDLEVIDYCVLDYRTDENYKDSPLFGKVFIHLEAV